MVYPSRAQSAKEKRDAAASKTIAASNQFDFERRKFDGTDKDNPRSDIDDEEEEIQDSKPGELDVDFKRILKTAFRIKGEAKHEVFEALQFAGIYT